MASKKKWVVVATALAAAATVLTTVQAKAATAPYSWAAGLPGCASSRPAVAHHADQQVLTHQPTDGPVPCGMLTGSPTVENRIEVTNANKVVYEPALTGPPVDAGSGNLPGGVRNGLTVAVTGNNGSTWAPVTVHVFPADEVGAQVDNNLYVDHTTGRLFWYMYSSAGVPGTAGGCGAGGGGTVAYSDDTINWGWGFDRDHDCAENPDILTGVPTVSDPAQMSYPNVVYLCGDNTSSGAATTGTAGYSCSKSLTGAATWIGTIEDTPVTAVQQGGVIQGYYAGQGKDMLAPYSQCAGGSSSAGADVQPIPPGLPGAGTLMVVVSCNSKTFLSESTDEGHTWNVKYELPHGGDLRVDSAGNLFLLQAVNTTSSFSPGAQTAPSQLLLSHSTDGGKTWSPELNIVAPGVTSVGTYNFAQGTYASGLVGQVAVTYYGINPNSPDGKNGYSDGFITETRDALDSNPVFWSGQVNDTGDPLLYNTQTDGNIGVTVLDLNGGAFSPNGQSVWGSWVQDCGTNIATSPNCQSRYPGTNPENPENGFAGRLVWPSGGASH